MDLERASSMIQALPSLSKTIVDDTLYEKVYSYITFVLHLLGDDSQAIVNLCQQSRLLDRIRQACINDPDPDYRIISLCIRLLGQFVRHGRDPVFEVIVDHDQYVDLLEVVTNGLTSSEPALRCACLEACRHFVWCHNSQGWLTGNRKVTTLIAYAILDQSTYVVAEACQLFSDLLRLDDREPLLRMVDPSDLVRSILHQTADERNSGSVGAMHSGVDNEQQVISALDFCWTVVNIKSPNALEYLRSTHLLRNLLQLIPIYQNKIIRFRVVEILQILFTYDDKPLETISYASNEKETNPADAYLMLIRLVKRLMPVLDIELMITAIALLNPAAILLGRMSANKENIDYPHSILYSILHTIYSIIAAQDQPSVAAIEYQNVEAIIAASTTRTKIRVLQQIFRVLNTLLNVQPQMIKEPLFIDFFSILSTTSIYSDPTLMRETITLLTNALKQTAIDPTMKAQQQQRDLFQKPIQSLIDTISKIDLGCKSFIIVLNLFIDLLGSTELGPLIINSAENLVDILKLKFIDTAWDIRDASVHFVGQLFNNDDEKKGVSGTASDYRLQFALQHDFPMDVFRRIHDSEPYVRASALEVLQKMMRMREGWEYIQQHEVSRELASTLPVFLYDTEAFVRRAAIDAISSLVRNRSCQGMIVGRAEGHASQSSLSPFVLHKLLNDEDTDVRIKLCRLIGNLWKLYYHEKHEARKKTQEHKELLQFFPEISPGKMLTEAATDMNRVVRVEGIRVIEEILLAYGDDNITNHEKPKRHFAKIDKDEFEESFILELKENVDLSRQKQTLDPEHLYQEAFEIDADIMTHSRKPPNSEDDVNMLDCE